MKKIILHIGSGKTGSSSIQKALEECKEVNRSIFNYPKLIKSHGNQVFRFGFCSSSSTTANVRGKYANDTAGFNLYQESIKSSFKEEVENSGVVVVSCEFLFSSPKEEVERINAFLCELGFSEIHVVMYLRDPAKYYLSVAQQSLKNQANIPKPHNFKYDLSGAIDNWTSIQPASLTVKEFNRDTLVDNDVVKDMEQFINGIVMGDAKLNLSRKQNETMSVEGAIILEEYQALIAQCHFDFEHRSIHMQRARKFARLASYGTKPKLKRDIISYIHERYLTELKTLNCKYGIFSDVINTLNINTPIKNKVEKFIDIVESFDIDSYLELKGKL